MLITNTGEGRRSLQQPLSLKFHQGQRQTWPKNFKCWWADFRFFISKCFFWAARRLVVPGSPNVKLFAFTRVLTSNSCLDAFEASTSSRRALIRWSAHNLPKIHQKVRIGVRSENFTDLQASYEDKLTWCLGVSFSACVGVGKTLTAKNFMAENELAK